MIWSMPVVSNTSPVSNLAILGDLDLLRRKFGQVTIPEAVRDELFRLDHPGAHVRIAAALQAGWLVVQPVTDRQLLPVWRNRIDEGESEAIELARQLGAELLILDDLEARAVAREEALPYTGLLGILAEERMAGRMASLQLVIHRLRTECRFFVSPDLENLLLRGVGEL